MFSGHIDRLFFALVPPPHAGTHVAHIRDVCAGGLNDRPILNEHLHMTLFIFEDRAGLSNEVIERAKGAAASLMFDTFRIVLDSIIGGKRSVLLLPSEPLKRLLEFQKELRFALKLVGLEPMRGWVFNPHITLRRGTLQGFRGRIDPVSWTVDRFALVHSLVGLTRHIPLAHWPLHRRRIAA